MTIFSPSRLTFVLAILVLGLISTPGRAEQYNTPPVRKVTVVGSATLKVVPDEMRWTVAINVNAASLDSAKTRHDASLGDALKFIKSLGSAVKDLQTGGIRIDKNSYAPVGSPGAERPFTCATQFTFTLIDFDKYGPMADALAKLDGVQVQSVDYASSKQDVTAREALKQALANAHDKASDLATSAGCYIDKPLEILEGSSDGPRPMVMSMMARSGGGGTPAAVPGQIEISATVTATYDLFYK